MLSQVTLQTSRNARRLVKAVQNRSGKMRERTPSYHQREKVTLHSGDATLKTETEYKDKISALTKKLVGADSLRRSRYEQLVAEHSEVISQLQRVICSSSSRLVPVGSIANSLCINNSDVDLCFVAENHDEFLRDFNENPNFKVALMRNVADLLEKSSELKLQYECVLLMRSRIPLVVVKLANGISVDIQFPSSNFHAVRNTNLIRHYVMADKRFPQLYMWARELFTALGARNSRQGLLSSYHIVLLVVHFLQCKHIFSEPVLPVLTQTHSHLVSRELPLSEIIKLMDRPITDELEGWSSANTMSVGTLAVKMIDYYTRFNIRTSMIDIANGRVVRRRQTPYNMKLQIMDPYSRITVCHSKDIVEAFYRAVTHTHEAFKSGSMIDSYPKFDDMAQAPQIRSEEYVSAEGADDRVYRSRHSVPSVMRLPLIPVVFYTILITVIVFVVYEFQSVDDEPFTFPRIFSIEGVLPASGLSFNKLFVLFPPTQFHIREGIEVHNDNFCVWYNYEVADNLKSQVSKEIPVTLTTFSTINYLDRLYKQMQSWEGMISYTAFFDSQSNQTPGLLSWIHNCMPDIKKLVSIHLVWPQKANTSCEEVFKQTALQPDKQNFDHEDCKPFTFQKALEYGRKISVTVEFPTNTLKNVARIGASGSLLHFPVEIENLISANAAAFIGQKVEFLTQESNQNKLLVVRQFEHDPQEETPRTVEQLDKLRQNDKAIMYHQMTNFRDHFVPDLKQWVTYSTNKNNGNVELKRIEYRGPDWEPQLIVRASDPLLYEGLNQQNIFGEELCRRDYEFYVISHVFTTKSGFEAQHEPLKTDDATVARRREFYAYLDRNFTNQAIKEKCSKMLDVPENLLDMI